jgi:hypothetical protein
VPDRIPGVDVRSEGRSGHVGRRPHLNQSLSGSTPCSSRKPIQRSGGSRTIARANGGPLSCRVGAVSARTGSNRDSAKTRTPSTLTTSTYSRPVTSLRSRLSRRR